MELRPLTSRSGESTVRRLSQAFHSRFGGTGRISRAPGRVNLIGEHTDYNDGFVLPAAVNLSCWVGGAPRTDRKLVVYAENVDQQVEVELEAIPGWKGPGWARYPLGVAWSLQETGRQVKGRNLYILGEVPLGSGLSSSAAIEVATALALLDEGERFVDRTELALLCQRAENEYVGARCGIMDQFIACRGQAGHALLLDCRSLERRPIPLPPDVAMVVCNSMVKHDISVSGYNVRREECEEGVRLLKAVLPTIAALRDLTSAQLEEFRQLLPERIYRRCRHVVTENGRVLKAVSALEGQNMQLLSRCMSESHKSLRDDFEVSCPELDALVEITDAQPGIVGARMMGGGFGGCTINLVRAQNAEAFVTAVAAGYEKRMGMAPEIYSLGAGEGAETIA
jgi:galactokinase